MEVGASLGQKQEEHGRRGVLVRPIVAQLAHQVHDVVEVTDGNALSNEIPAEPGKCDEKDGLIFRQYMT